jgi:hypothetical protein
LRIEARSCSKFCSLLSAGLLSNHFGASSSAAAPSASFPFSRTIRDLTKARRLGGDYAEAKRHAQLDRPFEEFDFLTELHFSSIASRIPLM